jgi:catechol 2,3-dioxygenase-like lactoylglutathione lyase family enzyme
MERVEDEMAFQGLGPIGQIHVSVTDVERSIEFYRDRLGLPFLFRVPERPMAFFDCDGVRLYLGVPESEAFRSRATLYFRVSDVEDAHRTLVERDVAFVDAPHVVARFDETELVMAFFRDPDGNNLALMEERALAQSTG